MDPSASSFHLRTPFLPQDIGTQKVKPTQRYVPIIQSTSYAGESSFADIIEKNKHLIALKNLEEVKNKYYNEYVENLEKKVLKHRKRLAKQEAVKEKPSTFEAHSKKANEAKLHHHHLRHDAEYMQRVSKSRYYHLLGARNAMVQEGMIKTQSDEDAFWNGVLHDSEFWSRPLPPYLSSDVMSRLIIDRYRSLKQQRTNRDRRVTFRDSPTKSFAATQSLDDSKSDGASKDMPQFKVKLQLPKLHSLKKARSPIISPVSLPTQDSLRTRKRLNKFQSVRHAYDVAMVNHAVVKQMLKRHGRSPDDPTEFLLNDIAAFTKSEHPSSQQQKTKSKLASTRLSGKDKQVFLTEPVYGSDEVLIPDLEYKYPHENHNARKKSKTKHKTYFEKEVFTDSQDSEDQTNNARKVINHPPLDYSMMLAQEKVKVKDATCLSSFWVNYINSSDDTSGSL